MNKAFAGDPYIRKVLEIVGLIASDKKGQRSVFDDITAFFLSTMQKVHVNNLIIKSRYPFYRIKLLKTSTAPLTRIYTKK